MSSTRRYLSILSSCGVFLVAALALVYQGPAMIRDADPFWHIAAGDWIRAHHQLPQNDPWSFSAGVYRWFNISWAWDTLFSYIHEQWGWYGAEAATALTVGLAIALTYSAGIMVCGDGIAAFFAIFAGLPILLPSLRPLEITNLMAALWMLLLIAVTAKKLHPAWLVALPVSMIVWVNSHGGFFIGFIMLVAFTVEALRTRDRQLVAALVAAGLMSFVAIFINPYGVGILEAVYRPLTTTANHILSEWQPFSFSPDSLLTHFYLPLFALLVFRYPLPVNPAVRWLSYVWLGIGLLTVRSLGVFVIISAPLLACRLKELLKPKRPPTAFAIMIRQHATTWLANPFAAGLGLALCIAFSVWLPSAAANRLLGIDQASIPSLAKEEDFIKTHYPHAHILIHFDLGGMVEYDTQGTIRTFMDGRTETAFPAQVMQDYIDFEYAMPGWERMLDHYHIDGVLIPKGTPPFVMARPDLYDRFAQRSGWKKAFDGPMAVLFMRGQ